MNFGLHISRNSLTGERIMESHQSSDTNPNNSLPPQREWADSYLQTTPLVER